jgi:hypothetical protein
MSVLHNITADSLSSQSFRVLHAGDDYDYEFTFNRNGSPIDFTGAQVWLTVKSRSIQSDIQAKLQLAGTEGGASDQIEMISPSLGKLVVKFRGEGVKTTADLEGMWEYDMQAKLLSPSQLITLARGKIEFLQNITRSTI